jgi:hypothetical protein
LRNAELQSFCISHGVYILTFHKLFQDRCLECFQTNVNGNFSIFDGYVPAFENLDASPVSCSLFINTGFTGPSGNPPNDLANDTFWQSGLQAIPMESNFLDPAAMNFVKLSMF